MEVVVLKNSAISLYKVILTNNHLKKYNFEYNKLI